MCSREKEEPGVPRLAHASRTSGSHSETRKDQSAGPMARIVTPSASSMRMPSRAAPDLAE
eukprot:CAMPEP_0174745226 /NCGR_PEP_ID=MMETSP1094-20130205/86310_1 /TAXON_ID=156173 /ORGANISM="Chrysochromulina brevifilum, Strain UTEX LB 985" /LENGTH=59 /DNA_ID=CAMNT_0015949755 /DNA_START=429 /DNA_END=608 /DNA_ORIENTATION=+